MADGFIVRKGGVAVDLTAAPSINFVSSTFDSITFTITNNDALTADIFWEVGDSTPDANTLSLAGGATSSNQVASGLDEETSYTIFAFANAANKAGSQTVSIAQTTPAEPIVWYGNRGLFAGGFTTVNVNTIDFVTVSTAGNATDFGDLTSVRVRTTGCSNGSRALFGSGNDATFPASNLLNSIDFVTVATTGNATDFGDLTQARQLAAACSNGIRGLFGGGDTATTKQNTIDFVTIATAGNATDFGDLTQARNELAACSSATRGVWAGGTTGSISNVIDFVTIATAGNATDFGDLTLGRQDNPGSCSNETRGLFAGGFAAGNNTNVIDFITIATAGNATDFGDLTAARRAMNSVSNGTRGLFAGGFTTGNVDTIDFVTIATAGNATDFGDLTQARRTHAGASGD